MTDFPHADSDAAKMLSEGLKRASIERGDTIRKLGAKLGFKQPVALSHMASGRMPIPVDRAPALADTIGIEKSAFVRAVLRQRHPTVDWESLIDGHSVPGPPYDSLPEERQSIIQEVINDRWPRERWLTTRELPIVLALRRRFPHFQKEGLRKEDLDQLGAFGSDEKVD